MTYTTSQIRTIALAVIAGVFFGGVATGVAFPTLPLLDEQLMISATMLSIVLSANRIARLVMNTPAGALIDRIGARRPMIAGLFTQALAPFGYIVGLYVPPHHQSAPLVGAVSLPGVVFVVARLFWGIGSAFVFIGAFTTVTQVTTSDDRGRWIGYMRGGQSLGFPTGLVAGGVLTDLFGMATAFLTAGVLSLLAGTVATVVLPDVHSGTDAQSARLSDVPALLSGRPSVLAVGFGNFTLRFLWGGIVLSTLARYAEHHDLELVALGAAGVSGVVMALGVVVSGTTTVLTGWLSDLVTDRTLLTFPAFVSMAAGFSLIAFRPAITPLLGAIVLVGIGMGMSAPALLAILGDLTPGEELGRMGGVYNGMGDVGLSLGPLVAIPAVDLWFGYRLTYTLCAVLACGCLVVVSVPLYLDTSNADQPVRAD